jgi:hypothetical protein
LNLASRHAAWLKTGRLFCCPNGHEQLFQVVPAEAKIAELKAKLDDLEKRLALALADNASLRDELSIWHPRSADSRHGDKL